MAQDIMRATGPHSVMIEGRERMTVSGVEDVESFNEESIVAFTTRGTLIIKGEGMHIERLSLDRGELAVEGEISLLEYIDEQRQSGGGLWSRLFK